MKKTERNLNNLYLLNNKTRGVMTPWLLNDLPRIAKENTPLAFDLPLARYILRTRKNSVLFPAGKKTLRNSFFLSQARRFPAVLPKINGKRVDSLFFNPQKHKTRPVYVTSLGQKDPLFEEIKARYANFSQYFQDLWRGSLQGPSLARAWNISIISAVIFGMVTMTFIYRYLGESVAAKIDEEKNKTVVQIETKKGQVLGAEDYMTDEAEVEFITKLIKTYDKNEKKDALKEEILSMVKGYPIESMVPEIAKQDKIVAAFMIAIAKKESSWGVHVPVYQGQDCFNYWGWRGKNPVGSGGHTCFDSPEDAVETVATRISILIDEYGRNTPEKMVVWKCGRDCEATGGQAAANKWIADVNLYFKKLNK